MKRVNFLALVVFATACLSSFAAAITVTVVPNPAQVSAGSTQQFSATATGTSNTSFLWSISGSGCQNSACGSINSFGLYTAPATPPSPSTFTVSAVSFADFKTTGSAFVTITPAVPQTVTVSPNPVQVNLGAQQQFSTIITGVATSPVSWSVSSPGCFINCGTITSSGLFTAPSSMPPSSLITVTVKVGLFPQIIGSATLTLTSTNAGGTLAVAPNSISLSAGGHQSFTATLNGVTTTAVNWSLSGVGCINAGCGTISSLGAYTAPSTISGPATVTVSANSSATGKTASATVTLIPASAISVSVLPQTVTVNTSAQQHFTANVTNASNSSVLWGLSCSTFSCGSIDASGLFTAPAAAPNPNTVTVTATSLADFHTQGSATVTIGGAVTTKVTISPQINPPVPGGTQRQLTATVTGPSNIAVTWTVSGQGCSGATCGTIASNGVYSAPAVIPFFPYVTVTATSQATPSVSASVTLQLTPNVVVTLAPPLSPMTSGTQQQFSATVTGTLNTAVTWSLSGSNCFPANCGAISSSGLYTSPAGLSSPIAVTVTATSQNDATKTASAVVSIVPPVIVTVSPVTAKISINSQQQFIANVTGTSNTAVTWSVSGIGCSGPACGTITSSGPDSGLYQAPSSVPLPASVTVTATLVSDNTKIGSTSALIVPSNNNKLSGHYAFLFTGFDGTVNYQAAGVFTADGNGNITNGVEDINCGPGAQDVVCGSAPVASLVFSGTYIINADGRGVLTINSALSTSVFALAVAPVSGDVRFTESDATGVRGAGVLKRQTQSDFSNNAFDGAVYSFGLTGVDSTGGRIGIIGQTGLAGDNPTGVVSGASLRINDRILHCDSGNSCDTTYTLGPNLSGTFNVDPTTGHGSLSINAAGFGSGVVTFGIDVVSRNEIFLASTDPLSTNPVLSGDMVGVLNPDDFVFFKSGRSVISWSGLNGTTPDVVLGTILFGANKNVSPQALIDENKGGVVTLNTVVCPNCVMLPGLPGETKLLGALLGSF